MWHMLFGPPKVEQMKERRDIKGLSKALFYQHHFGIAYAAAHALEEVGDESAVEPLIKALRLPDIHMRLLAVRALGRIGDERAVDSLLELLTSSNRQSLLDQIDRINLRQEPVADLLEEVIPDLNANNALRVAAAETFMLDEGDEIQDFENRQEAAAMYLNSLARETPRIRKHAAKLLRELVKDVDEEMLRKRAVRRHREALQRELEVLKAILRSLSEIDDSRSVETVRTFIEDEDADLAREAGYALSKFSGQAG